MILLYGRGATAPSVLGLAKHLQHKDHKGKDFKHKIYFAPQAAKNE